MKESNPLLRLDDSELQQEEAGLVRRCNETTAQLIEHLVEVDRRVLWAVQGFRTLFAYCVEKLGMSEGAAGRRYAAVRVCRDFPEVLGLVARGELHLSAVCALQ